MWSFGTKDSKGSKESLDIPDIPDIPELKDLDINIQYNDEELNDPDLLAELASMTINEPTTVKPIAKPKPKPSIVNPDDIDQILSTIPKDIDQDIQVEFTDDDMNDPALLAELNLVEGHEPVSKTSPMATNPPQSDDEFKDSTINDSKIVKLLESRSAEYKKSALTFKKLNNLEKAREMLAISKTIQSYLSSYHELGILDPSFKIPPSPPPISNLQSPIPSKSNTVEVINSPVTQAVPPTISSPQVVGIPPKLDIESEVDVENEGVDDLKKVQLLEARLLEYKKAALGFKKQNMLEKAREMLAISKLIQQQISSYQELGIFDPNFKIPGKPMDVSTPTKTPTLSPGPTATTEETQNHLPSSQIVVPTNQTSVTPDLLQHLENTLESQISLCTKLSAQYFTANQKDLALEFHKRKKGLIDDRTTLKSLKSLKQTELPFRFSYTTLDYTIAQSHNDVALDEMEINIIRGLDYIVKDVNEIESGVSFDAGWPFDPNGTRSEGKGDSCTVIGNNPEYNFKTKIKIERTKSFQRFLERKKATFELFYLSKSLFGMLSKKIVMDPSNPRKPTGAKVEIKIRLRAPLVKPDIAKLSEKWLVLTFGETNVLEIPTKAISPVNNAKIVTGTAASQIDDSKLKPLEPSQNVISRPTSASSPNLQTSKETSTAKSTPSANASKQSLVSENQVSQEIEDDLEANFLNPDNIKSNQVLEHEHGLIVQQIVQLKAKGMAVPEDLNFQKSGYEIKMNMLVTSIQMGMLDMPGYCKSVKEAMVVAKENALEFKKRGKLDLAKQALTRLKLMTSEMAEVEAA
ncbi:hypothetical protein HDV02_002562 [Globomyces sp. JEL0801]|nr:hypothetical protein HDV02_002562 [Globomyces sp. JEL0801]